MKIKNGFVLRKFADRIVAVADDDMADYCNSFIKMNSTGEFVWNLLQNDVEYDFVINSLCNDEATARADFDEFLAKVRKAGLLDE
ncbi:PqqD family protein [Ruminococcus sp.]|uniref:PqqD family protein n=1 Tax=Ruminococcus sp. TaxID=41978 RepID=UPI003865D3D2